VGFDDPSAFQGKTVLLRFPGDHKPGRGARGKRMVLTNRRRRSLDLSYGTSKYNGGMGKMVHCARKNRRGHSGLTHRDTSRRPKVHSAGISR